MTTREEWLRLAERCEAATGPDDRAVIASTTRAVLSALGYEEDCGYWHVPSTGKWVKDCNRIMISLDAITTLIEREMPKTGLALSRIARKICTATLFPDNGAESYSGEGDTLALALTAAFCRAKAGVER